MTFTEFKQYLSENFQNPEVLKLRKEWALEHPMTLDRVRAFFHENATKPEVTDYRLTLAKVNEKSLRQEIAAEYIKAKPNPFKRETFNLTEQGSLYRTDRLLFDALKEAASPNAE